MPFILFSSADKLGVRALSILLIIYSMLAYAKSIKLDELKALNPGEKISTLPKTFESDEFSYDLDSKDGKLVGLTIYFNKLAESKELLSQDQKGHCLVQTSSGDFVIQRYYFFNEKLNKRYEVTRDYRVKSIKVQDMSGASKYRSCLFKDLVRVEKEKVVRKKK